MSLALHSSFSGLLMPPTAMNSSPATFVLLACDRPVHCFTKNTFFPVSHLNLTLLLQILGTTCFYQDFTGILQLKPKGGRVACFGLKQF